MYLRKKITLRAVHYISIAIAILLVVILYYGANTVPPKKSGATQPMSESRGPMQPQIISASFDSILNASRKNIPAHANDEIKNLENKLSQISDSSKMPDLIDSLAHVWQQHKQFPVAAYYFLKSGKLENSEKKLTFAAQLFLDLARKANSESVQAWEGQLAIEGFNKVLEIDPKNDSVKIDLAECYIGTGSTMQGVLLLRDVSDRNPDNIRANIILGQQGIVSGQLDKAMGRFERVLKLEPNNVEAILGLAEVYKNKGDKEKAKELLEQSKKIMNNPDYSKDIDNYIKSFN